MSSAPTKLECRGVWKLYGPGDPTAFLAGNPDPDDAALKRAGMIAAVRDVSLEIRVGEIFVIMGLSGSGKSTLVRCMARLIDATAGAILLDGRNLLEVDEKEMIEIRRHRMGMVFQQFALLPHLSVLDNVAFPLRVQGVDRVKRESRARAMIDLVGLKGREFHFPRALSGGQQQRVGIARSLAVEPEVWFLDEPFSALDPLIRREMQDELLRLQAGLHKTLIFITHDFDEAIRLADRIAIMRDGRVIQVGTPEEMVISPADDYVADFTRHVTKAKVVSARTVMAADDPVAAVAGAVSARDRIADIAERVESADRPHAVMDEAGNRVGLLDRKAVIDVLVGRAPRA